MNHGDPECCLGNPASRRSGGIGVYAVDGPAKEKGAQVSRIPTCLTTTIPVGTVQARAHTTSARTAPTLPPVPVVVCWLHGCLLALHCHASMDPKASQAPRHHPDARTRYSGVGRRYPRRGGVHLPTAGMAMRSATSSGSWSVKGTRVHPAVATRHGKLSSEHTQPAARWRWRKCWAAYRMRPGGRHSPSGSRGLHVLDRNVYLHAPRGCLLVTALQRPPTPHASHHNRGPASTQVPRCSLFLAADRRIV